ncbi:MAG TPA: hypothetical protein PKA05_07020 [Roseiflexaceae bacterium]|nr:hypothetical protein [Roseiflexaceae bacterium]
MTSSAERLYNLLPAIYRARDAEHGRMLRGLLALIETELAAIEADIEQLYEDAFIETSAEWVVPYIGDLLAVQPIHEIGLLGGRAYVANTIARRRRKGTAAVVEQLARDVTGWPVRVVECFEQLIATQHLNHRRPHCRATPDLRDVDALERLGGPFEQAMHSVVVAITSPIWRSSSGDCRAMRYARVMHGPWRSRPMGVTTSAHSVLIHRSST